MYTTVSITKELAARIREQGAEMGHEKCATYAQLLLRIAMDIIDKNGFDNFMAAKYGNKFAGAQGQKDCSAYSEATA